MQMATLTDWKRVLHPLHQVPVLRGTVSGHPRIEDGQTVYTTDILDQGEGYCQTRNTRYILVGPEVEN
jgi:hypothetical protein